MQKPYTIVVKSLDSWYSAVCPQLCVSGFGKTKNEAIESLVRAMRSTLQAQATLLHKDSRNIKQVAEFAPVAA
jgi:hypothetical protein